MFKRSSLVVEQVVLVAEVVVEFMFV